MWNTKTFKTAAAMAAWMAKNEGAYQMEVIFVNNAYGVTFKKLRRVY